MSITDELRKYASSLGTLVYASTANVKRALEEIADRIDQEHERATAGCIHYDPERHYCSVHGDTERGWVKLPVDAEGIPFHVGDHVEVPDGLPSEGKPWQVGTITRLDLGAMCWHVRVIAGGMYHDYLVENVRHYHAPTVEDVLRDFYVLAVRGKEAHAEDVDEGVLAEYAAKLRLAGEDA